MKERLVSEINSGMSQGSEYTKKIAGSALFFAEQTARAVCGKTVLVRHTGKWVSQKGKPGIIDLIKNL